jgi:hypothetical protein
MQRSESSGQAGDASNRHLSWTAVGFLLAFILSVVTVILTGLAVKAPRSHSIGAEATAEMTAPASPLETTPELEKASNQ